MLDGIRVRRGKRAGDRPNEVSAHRTVIRIDIMDREALDATIPEHRVHAAWPPSLKASHVVGVFGHLEQGRHTKRPGQLRVRYLVGPGPEAARFIRPEQEIGPAVPLAVE